MLRVEVSSENLWILKYRPKNLDELVGRTDFIRAIKDIASSGSIPNMIFSGISGHGKTISAVLAAKYLLGDYFQTNCKIVYASDPLDKEERDLLRKRSYISTSRVGSAAGTTFNWPAFTFSRVKPFVELRPIGGRKLKILIVKDFHALGGEQQAFRRLMEKYSENCRMFLITDEISSIIDPIISRCRVFFFGSIPEADYTEYISKICINEGIKVEKKTIRLLYRITDGKIGDSINLLQKFKNSSPDKVLDGDSIFGIITRGSKYDIKSLLGHSLEGNYGVAKKLCEKLIGTGFTLHDIVGMISDEVFYLPLPDEMKAALLNILGEFDFSSVEYNDENIHLHDLIYRLGLFGKKIKNL